MRPRGARSAVAAEASVAPAIHVTIDKTDKSVYDHAIGATPDIDAWPEPAVARAWGRIEARRREVGRFARFRVEPHEDAPGIHRLAFAGEFDLAAVPLAEEQLGHVDCSGLVLFDLRGLTFMDSSGLKLLVEGERRVREAGGRLAIVRGPRAVHMVLEITRAVECFEIVDDPADAAA